MGKKYRSDALAAVHETTVGLYEAGVIGKQTMKEFDEIQASSSRALTSIFAKRSQS